MPAHLSSLARPWQVHRSLRRVAQLTGPDGRPPPSHAPATSASVRAWGCAQVSDSHGRAGTADRAPTLSPPRRRQLQLDPRARARATRKGAEPVRAQPDGPRSPPAAVHLHRGQPLSPSSRNARLPLPGPRSRHLPSVPAGALPLRPVLSSALTEGPCRRQTPAPNTGPTTPPSRACVPCGLRRWLRRTASSLPRPPTRLSASTSASGCSWTKSWPNAKAGRVRHLKAAKLRSDAVIEDLDFASSRGLERYWPSRANSPMFKMTTSLIRPCTV